MTTTSKVVTVLGLLSGLVAASATAQAKVLEHIVFHDNTSVLSFDSSTPLDCPDINPFAALTTHATLNGFEFTNKSTTNGDVRSNSAVVSIFQQNGCTGEFFFGVGDLDGGFTQDGLKSAHWQGTVPITNFSGGPDGVVIMNVTMTGTGPITTNQQHFRFSIATPDGPGVETIHTNGKSVAALISSFSLSFNGVAVPAPAPDFFFSEIAVSKAGTMELVKSGK
jgi:hypothetical protein